jgi:hypothetical protein
VSTRPDLPSYRTLLIEVDRGVATITLNRPQVTASLQNLVAAAAEVRSGVGD